MELLFGIIFEGENKQVGERKVKYIVEIVNEWLRNHNGRTD